jgi:hypothetical protein
MTEAKASKLSTMASKIPHDLKSVGCALVVLALLVCAALYFTREVPAPEPGAVETVTETITGG